MSDRDLQTVLEKIPVMDSKLEAHINSQETPRLAWLAISLRSVIEHDQHFGNLHPQSAN